MNPYRLHSGCTLVMTAAVACLILSLLVVAHGRTEIYKYQKNGVWYYTDTPPEDMPSDSQQIEKETQGPQTSTGSKRKLLAGFTAANAIERAAAGTVFIQTTLGTGSGFFISQAGHIITNKHVIRVVDATSRQEETQIDQIEARIAAAEAHFDNESQRLQEYQNQLDALKQKLDAERHSTARQHYSDNYSQRLEYYQRWQSDYQKRFNQFEIQKEDFESKRAGNDYRKSVANLSQSFTITLADNSQHYVRLIATSTDHDLALLKLDGYQTPTLQPASTMALAQGDPVYAIGSPAQLKNSVTSGIFSGLERGFIQTNAQIYPGNSGGPLVNAQGSVLGINTFKHLTHKFEGLGFAIPIQVALREFRAHLAR